VDLKSFQGKFVLLDFWVSWCISCRESAPELIKIFSRFHSKSLEIIGIYIDNNRNAWKEAIAKDNTDIWYHLISNKTLPEDERID
jgi:thiol-disulfide isomerase/thioredoxin